MFVCLYVYMFAVHEKRILASNRRGMLGFIGLEQSGVNPVGADGFQVVQGTTAEEGFGRGQEWGVKLAEQGRGRIHLSAYIPIVLLTS